MRGLTGDKGLINEAKQTKSAAEIQGLKEQIELSKVKAELKSNNVTMETVIQQLIKDGVIADESQVNKENGDITFGDSVLEGELAEYVISPGEKYYGNKNIMPTNQKYFNFTVDAKAGTATLTGVKDEYAVKAYQNGEATQYTVVIKDGDTYVKDVVIPYEYVEADGKKYSVTIIGTSAFQGLTGDNVTNVEERFTSFVLPNTITIIGKSTFDGTTNLESVNIPSSVKKIYEWAFKGCGGVPKVLDLSDVELFGVYAFYECTTLERVKFSGKVDNVPAFCFTNCTNLKSVILTDGITKIEQHAFKLCTSLAEINLPDSLINIEWGAFNGCASLSSINIPENVTSIGVQAFAGCKSLTSVNIPDGVQTIGSNMFAYCYNLNNIEIPNSVTSIGQGAFVRCEKITRLNIPQGVTEIGRGAFQQCYGLEEIYVPSSVTIMGPTVFFGWDETQTINCEILESQKPDTWDAQWDYYNGDNPRKAQLNWGVSR